MTKARFDEMMKAWLFENGITLEDLKKAKTFSDMEEIPIKREIGIETSEKTRDNKPKGTNGFSREEFKADHPFMPNEDYKEGGE